MAAAKRGKPSANRGKIHSEETRQKMGRKKGSVPWNKGNKGTTPWNKNQNGVQKYDEAHRQACSIGAKRRWAKVREGMISSTDSEASNDVLA